MPKFIVWKPQPLRVQQLARTAVAQAIRCGLLTKEPCIVCGDAMADGHHEDYKKPLRVVWLCRSHHCSRHAELRAGTALPLPRKWFRTALKVWELPARGVWKRFFPDRSITV
jgi:hypothetical protein